MVIPSMDTFLFGGGDAHEFAFVGAGNRPCDGQLFPFADDIFKREAQIRDAGDEARNLAFVGLPDQPPNL